MTTSGSNWAVIKLYADVKSKLDFQKKSKSYSVYINDMLLYFDVLNLSPESFSTHPSIEILKAIDRVIKIIRAIEKDKINPILENTRTLTSDPGSVAGDSSRMKIVEDLLQEINSGSDEQLTLDELLQFVEASKEQKNEIEELKIKIQKLQKTEGINSIVPTPGEENIFCDIKQVLELIEYIENKMTQRDGKMIIDKSIYVSYMERIKNELKNVRKSS